MAHVTYCCLQALSNPIGSLIDEGANAGLASLMSACLNTLNIMQTLWE